MGKRHTGGRISVRGKAVPRSTDIIGIKVKGSRGIGVPVHHASLISHRYYFISINTPVDEAKHLSASDAEESSWVFVEHPSDGHDDDNNSNNPLVYATSSNDLAPKAIDSGAAHTQRPSRYHTRDGSTHEQSATITNGDHGSAEVSLEYNRAARAQARHERQRYNQYCTLVNLTLDRLSAATSQPHYATDDFRSLRQQLSDDVRTVVEQLNVLHQNGEDTLRPSRGLWPTYDATAPHVNALAAATTYGGLRDANPPVVEEYIRRAGDASIASERLAELEYALAVEQARGLPESVLEHERAAKERRQELEAELRSALRDTAMLERACIAQGHDPEQARYRWAE
ncbi:hypothetical protein LTR53_001120 [Teratosphaeriaceae sp. CCFEE 6253]|nr:hypothetical protein LTR53_001120 [Teratosphaeriaceae sp. CCFEE 6253]